MEEEEPAYSVWVITIEDDVDLPEKLERIGIVSIDEVAHGLSDDEALSLHTDIVRMGS